MGSVAERYPPPKVLLDIVCPAIEFFLWGVTVLLFLADFRCIPTGLGMDNDFTVNHIGMKLGHLIHPLGGRGMGDVNNAYQPCEMETPWPPTVPGSGAGPFFCEQFRCPNLLLPSDWVTVCGWGEV